MGAIAGHLKNLQQSRSLTFEEACFYDNVGDILAAPTRVEPGAGREAVRQGKLPDPALPEVGSPSVREGVSGQSWTRGH